MSLSQRLSQGWPYALLVLVGVLAAVSIAALSFLIWRVMFGPSLPGWVEPAGNLSSGAAVALLTILVVRLELQRDAEAEGRFEVEDAELVNYDGVSKCFLSFAVINSGRHASAVRHVELTTKHGAVLLKHLTRARSPNGRAATDWLVESGDRVMFTVTSDGVPQEGATIKAIPVIGKGLAAPLKRVKDRPLTLAELRNPRFPG